MTSSEHPAAADIHNLPGHVFGLFGGEKRHGSGNVFDRRGARNRKTRVANPPCFFHSQLILVNAGRIYDIYGDPVLGLLQR